MNPDSTENTGSPKPSDAENQMVQDLNALKRKNAELRAILAFERQEIIAYQARHKRLTDKVNNVNASLEKTVRTYFTLLEDSKNALHMGRSALLSTALSDSTASISSPKPGPSVITKKSGPRFDSTEETLTAATAQAIPGSTRKKFPMERIQMKEFKKSFEGNNSYKTDNSMTTPECSNASDAKSLLKELKVHLSRLPNSVLEQHSQKSTLQVSSNATLTSSGVATPSSPAQSFMNNSEGPDFTSTPLKLEAMKGLGLCPIESVRGKFVSSRKPETDTKQGVKRSLLEPIVELPVVQKKKRTETPKNTKSKAKKNKAPTVATKPKTPKSPVVGRSPKVRKAKPQQLKEPSCKGKLRRIF